MVEESLVRIDPKEKAFVKKYWNTPFKAINCLIDGMYRHHGFEIKPETYVNEYLDTYNFLWKIDYKEFGEDCDLERITKMRAGDTLMTVLDSMKDDLNYYLWKKHRKGHTEIFGEDWYEWGI